MFLNELMQHIDYTEIVNRSGKDPSAISIDMLTSDSRKAFSFEKT